MGEQIYRKVGKDLQNEFPGVEGFSRRNVFRIKAFYKEYEIVPPLVAQIFEIEHLGVLTQIPWSYNIILMEKLDTVEQRLWYATKTVENRRGKKALEDWIERDIYFYHIPSHRYIAVELKTEHFKPEHTGQMNFYLAAIDDMLKSAQDNPSIGLILCKKEV